MLDIASPQIKLAPNLQNDIQARLQQIELKLILLKLNPELLENAERLDQIAQFSTSPKDGPIIIASLKEAKPRLCIVTRKSQRCFTRKPTWADGSATDQALSVRTLSQGIATAFAGDTAKIHEAIFGSSEKAVFGLSTWRVSSVAINVCPRDRIKIDGNSPGFAPVRMAHPISDLLEKPFPFVPPQNTRVQSLQATWLYFFQVKI